MIYGQEDAKYELEHIGGEEGGGEGNHVFIK